MSYQTGRNVRVAYRVESVFGTAPGATGATQFRATPSSGLKLARAPINSSEIRSDGQSEIARLGSRSVSGNYIGELSMGTFNALFEAVLRGTFVGTALVPGTTPTRRSFTFEEYQQDIDISQQFLGCRVSSMRVNCPPNAHATVDFGIVGRDMAILTGGAAPYFTGTPSVTSTIGLVAVDAAISLGGSPILDLTAVDFMLDLKAKDEAMIGTTLTPDVFDNQMTISGSLSAVRKDAALQSDFLGETHLALVIALAEPSPGTGVLTFTLPKIVLTDYASSFGADGALIATIPFTAGFDSVTGGMIKIDSVP